MTSQKILRAKLPRDGLKKDPNDYRKNPEILARAIQEATPYNDFDTAPEVVIDLTGKAAGHRQDENLVKDCTAGELSLLRDMELTLKNYAAHHPNFIWQRAILIRRLVVAIRSCFWSGSRSKLFLLNIEGRLVQFDKTDAIVQIVQNYGDFVDWKYVQIFLSGDGKSVEKACLEMKRDFYSAILHYLKNYRQSERVDYEVDMFAESPHMEIREERVRIVLIHTVFEEGGYDQRFVNDYKEHFPEVDEVLEFIVASRFALDRKGCYLWFWADSDFGKGFFMGILVDLGLVVSTSAKEVEALFEGRPVAKSPEDFKRAFVLWLDEVAGIKGELKLLQSSMSLAPKFQLSSTVPLYCKLFTSKETIGGLLNEGTIEDQFANRFSILRKRGKITDRPLFNAEKSQYTRSVQAYVAKFLNKLIRDYQELGQLGAEAEAEQVIADFRTRWKASNFYQPASENLPDLAEQFVRYIGESQDLRNKYAWSGPVSGRSVTIITTFGKAFGAFVEDCFSKSDAKAIAFQKDAVLDLITGGYNIRNHKVNRKSKKGAKLSEEFKAIFDEAQRSCD